MIFHSYVSLPEGIIKYSIYIYNEYIWDIAYHYEQCYIHIVYTTSKSNFLNMGTSQSMARMYRPHSMDHTGDFYGLTPHLSHHEANSVLDITLSTHVWFLCDRFWGVRIFTGYHHFLSLDYRCSLEKGFLWTLLRFRSMLICQTRSDE